MSKTMSVCQGDITTLKVDAIVNAANSTLLGGGGVDGAIHRAAGPALREACRQLGGCATGAAKLTPAFELPARFVIHTVGPVWHGGNQGEAALLRACYQSTLALAVAHELATVAYPSISTGAYGYPIEHAAQIAIRTVRAALAEQETVREVIFCCYSERDRAVYEHVLASELRPR